MHTFVTKFMAFDHGVPNLKLWPAAVITDVATETWERIVSDLEELTTTLAGRGAATRANRLLTSAAMTGVLGRIESLPAQSPPVGRSGRRVPDTVAAALVQIREHPADTLTTGALAARLHTSPDALRKAFQRSMGQSPGEFVRQYRLTLARSLLRQSELSIAAIARRTGFSDPFYFSRVFRAAEGVPPTQWRDSLDDPLTTTELAPHDTTVREGHR